MYRYINDIIKINTTIYSSYSYLSLETYAIHNRFLVRIQADCHLEQCIYVYLNTAQNNMSLQRTITKCILCIGLTSNIHDDTI